MILGVPDAALEHFERAAALAREAGSERDVAHEPALEPPVGRRQEPVEP